MALSMMNSRIAAPRRSVVAKASGRPLWLPGVAAPGHLNGKLAGEQESRRALFSLR